MTDDEIIDELNSIPPLADLRSDASESTRVLHMSATNVMQNNLGLRQTISELRAENEKLKSSGEKLTDLQRNYIKELTIRLQRHEPIDERGLKIAGLDAASDQYRLSSNDRQTQQHVASPDEFPDIDDIINQRIGDSRFYGSTARKSLPQGTSIDKSTTKPKWAKRIRFSEESSAPDATYLESSSHKGLSASPTVPEKSLFAIERTPINKCRKISQKRPPFKPSTRKASRSETPPRRPAQTQLARAASASPADRLPKHQPSLITYGKQVSGNTQTKQPAHDAHRPIKPSHRRTIRQLDDDISIEWDFDKYQNPKPDKDELIRTTFDDDEIREFDDDNDQIPTAEQIDSLDFIKHLKRKADYTDGDGSLHDPVSERSVRRIKTQKWVDNQTDADGSSNIRSSPPVESRQAPVTSSPLPAVASAFHEYTKDGTLIRFRSEDGSFLNPVQYTANHRAAINQLDERLIDAAATRKSKEPHLSGIWTEMGQNPTKCTDRTVKNISGCYPKGGRKCTCRACFNSHNPCLRYSDDDGYYFVPLPAELRKDFDPTDMRYFVSGKDMHSKVVIKEYGKIWDDR